MRTPVSKLTTHLVHALGNGDYLLIEGQPGLVLVAGYGQSRAYTWYWRHRSEGALRRLKLGRWPAMSLVAASAAREKLDRERQDGTNHTAVNKAARAAAKAVKAQEQQAACSMKDVAENYLQLLEKTRKAKAVYDVRLVLKPVTVDEPAAEWTRSRAAGLLHTIAARAPSMARTLRQEMVRAWDYAVSTGRLDETLVNPWAALKNDASLKGLLKGKRGTRYFSDAEIATFLKWLPTAKMSQSIKDALALTLMLGARSGEVVAMCRDDLDLEGGTWSIKDTKTDAPRTIRLPTQALAIIKGRMAGKWVFPSTTTGKHMRQHAVVWAVAKDRGGLKDWSAHDLRRTCRTGLSRLGCPSEIAEAAIGHTKAGIIGVYDLHTYEKEVGEWLQKWNDHIKALTSDNVIAIDRKRA